MNGANEILDAVRALVPTVATRAEDVAGLRTLPLDLVEQLTEAGCFRMLVPASHGGAELDLTAQMRVLEELARADGSVGWTVMIGCSAPVSLGLLPRTTFDELYADCPDVILAGVFNPTGVATPVGGGFRVSGQWSFASGCQHAHWFMAHCVVDDGRQPPVRMMVLPPDDIEIKDTWSVSGLAGTGSHDFVVTDAFVPGERTFALDGEPCLHGPLHRIPEMSLSTLAFASVAVGIAQAAFDDVLTLAVEKVPAFGATTLAANPHFQYQLGETDARLRAARSALYHEAESTWASAVAATPLTPQDRARIRTTTTWVTRAATAVVDMAYTAAGGSSNYLSSPLQRRLRDILALTQHFAVKPDTFTMAGAVLAGQDVDLTLL